MSIIGKAAKHLVKKTKAKKKPNKKTRIARNKRKNIKEANKAEDREWAERMGGNPNYPKPSTQSKKKRAKAKSKSRYNQELRKEDRYERDKYGRSNIPF